MLSWVPLFYYYISWDISSDAFGLRGWIRGYVVGKRKERTKERKMKLKYASYGALLASVLFNSIE